MPCPSAPDPYFDLRDARRAIDDLSSKLCHAISLLETVLPVPDELEEWWRIHRAEDDARKAEAARQLTRVSGTKKHADHMASVRARLMTQLSADELEALGIE